MRVQTKGIVVFNTPGANANGVKELVIAGLMLASRDVVGGINWVNDNKEDENIAKSVEKGQEGICRMRDQGKETGRHRTGSDRCEVANAAIPRYGGLRIRPVYLGQCGMDKLSEMY